MVGMEAKAASEMVKLVGGPSGDAVAAQKEAMREKRQQNLANREGAMAQRELDRKAREEQAELLRAKNEVRVALL